MKKYFLFISTALILLGMNSCEKEQFDKELYNEYVDYEFMVDYMDPTHEWNLMKSDTLTVITPNNVQSIQILTENNYTSTEAEIAAEGICYGSETTLAYTIPIVQNTVYLAAISTNGNYIGVVPFNYGTKELDLTTTSLQSYGSPNQPTNQTFTYLFEEDFPLPGDFDYNDVVLRISKGYKNASYQVELHVKLEAAGASKKIAGAIHLGGIKYDDVKQVDITFGGQMDKDYPLARNYIGSENTLIKGRNGEAVINLFEDVHWALLRNSDTNGNITRLKLNTSHTDVENQSALVYPLTATYCITFYSREVARSLTFDRIDPFILEEYNGGVWEVHTYKYKFNDVLKNIFRGNQDAYDNHVSWCVVVPEKDFRYPIEGMSLGTYSKQSGEVFGPYHSFAYWMQNQKNYNDWYKIISSPQLLY